MPRDALGEFEHGVLLAILQAGGESYTVPIVEALEAATGRPAAPAAVYIALTRLERRGYLRSRRDAQQGRERRYFAVTDEAVERLREARRSFEKLWRGLDRLEAET